jgi:hypothetical protein
MNIVDIEKMWDVDCIIDKARLDDESLSIPKLHNKYQKLFRQAKTEFRRVEAEKKAVHNILYDYYSGALNSDPDRLAMLQRPPLNKKYTKENIERLISGEHSYVLSVTELAEIEEVIDYLMEVVKQINNRSYHIKNAIQFLAWSRGDG